MSHRGDFATGAVIYGKFSTFQPSTGKTFALAGATLGVAKDNSTNLTAVGATVVASFGSVAGLNHFAVDTSSDGTFYASGSFFDVYLSAGTVDSVTVTGAWVASFTLNKTAALRPTTAGRTLLVDSGGTVTGAVAVGGITTSSFASGAINAAAIAADAITAAKVADGTIDAATFAAGAINAAAIADGAIDAATFAAGAINAAAIASDAITAAKIADGAIDSATFAAGAIDAAAIAANAIGASELAADAVAEIADGILGRNVAGGADGTRTVSEALYVLRNKTEIVAGSLNVYGTDDTTLAWTATVATTAGNPISSIDPA